MIRKLRGQIYKGSIGEGEEENKRSTRSIGMVTDPRSIIRILQEQLQGYGSEDITRELLQNADDAGAERLDFYVVGGQDASAPHPLLRSPGLLVYNDGPFLAEDEDGIRRIIGGSKETDYDKIGRFGLGLKSVFNICDAFFYYSHVPAGKDKERLGGLLDPYCDLREKYGAKGKLELWEDISGDAGEYLDNAVRNFIDNGGREGFILFIPFRVRSDLMSIRKEIISVDRARAILCDSLSRIRLSLSLLKNVCLVRAYDAPSLSKLNEATEWFSASTEGQGTLSRPEEAAFERRLDRKVTCGGRAWICRGAEIFAPENKIFLDIKNRADWPVVPVVEEKQKAAPHAAIMIMGEAGQQGRIFGRWASYLPLTDKLEANEYTVFSLGESGDRESRCDILLHGFFFLKSDRKSIPGVTARASGIEAEWNRAILEELIAPLAPKALYTYLSLNPEEWGIASAFRRWLEKEGLAEKACSRDILVWDVIAKKWALLRKEVYPLPPVIPARITNWLKGRKETFIAADQGLYLENCIPATAPRDFLAEMLKFLGEDSKSIDEEELKFIDALFSLKPYVSDAEQAIRRWAFDLLQAGLYNQKKGINENIKAGVHKLADRFLARDLLFAPMTTEPALRAIARDRSELLSPVLILPWREEAAGKSSSDIPNELYAYLDSRLADQERQPEAEIALADFLVRSGMPVPDNLKLFRVAIFKGGKRLYGDKGATRDTPALEAKKAEALLFTSSNGEPDGKILELYSGALDPDVEIWRQTGVKQCTNRDITKTLCQSINKNLWRLSRNHSKVQPLVAYLLANGGDTIPEGVAALRGLLAGADLEKDAILTFPEDIANAKAGAGFYFISSRWKNDLNGAQIKN